MEIRSTKVAVSYYNYFVYTNSVHSMYETMSNRFKRFLPIYQMNSLSTIIPYAQFKSQGDNLKVT